MHNEIYLHPGQLKVVREPVLLGTLVGSCVAVCLYSPGEGGGMNHYVLPWQGPPGDLSGKHGPRAIELLVSQLEDAGIPRSRLAAKIFGGASPLGHLRLGADNSMLAFRAMSEAGIPVLASDVGGGRGRRIVFDPLSGEVWVREL
jgi:chemotaxis protein CheD